MQILITLFDQAQTLPVQLGPLGTILVLVLAIASAALNIVQLSQRNSAQKWRAAADAAQAAAEAHALNLTAVRERADAVAKENELKAQRIGVLEARTDLDAVRAQIAEIGKQIAHESSEAQLIIVQTIQQVSKDMMMGFLKHAEEDRQHQQRFAQILDGLEQRISLALDLVGGDTGKAAGSSGRK